MGWIARDHVVEDRRAWHHAQPGGWLWRRARRGRALRVLRQRGCDRTAGQVVDRGLAVDVLDLGDRVGQVRGGIAGRIGGVHVEDEMIAGVVSGLDVVMRVGPSHLQRRGVGVGTGVVDRFGKRQGRLVVDRDVGGEIRVRAVDAGAGTQRRGYLRSRGRAERGQQADGGHERGGPLAGASPHLSSSVNDNGTRGSLWARARAPCCRRPRCRRWESRCHLRSPSAPPFRRRDR